jgi:hypothetical protein
MRLLANENFPLDAVEALRADGHDVAWIREDSRGISDDKVLLRARKKTVLSSPLIRISVNWHFALNFQHKAG